MATLESAVLGRTGLSVTRLGYGSLNLGGRNTRLGRIVDPAVAERVLNAVLDAGITLIDTAPDYGEAEEVIGRCLAARRDEYVLTSKCGCPVGALADLPIPQDRPRDHDHTRENIRAGVEQSLRRLRTDHLDLVQVHNSPSRAELEANDSIAELELLRRDGKTRFIGISSTVPDVLDHLEMGVFDVIQVPYSAFQQEHLEAVHRAGELGIGVIVRGGVAQGSLASTAEAAPAFRRDQVVSQRDAWRRSGLDDLLDGMPPMEFMLRYTLSTPDVTSAIVGTASEEHLAENVAAAAKGPLPADVFAEAQQRLTSLR